MVYNSSSPVVGGQRLSTEFAAFDSYTSIGAFKSYQLAMSWWKLLRLHPRPQPAKIDMGPKPLEKLMERVETTPDRPVPFGYKMSWLTIRSEDAMAVCEALDMENLQPANWQSGFIAAYGGHSFLSPPIDGWVFLVGHELPELGHPPHDRAWSAMLEGLSREFGMVQYFATHRVSGFDAWACYKNGKEQRAFAYCDEVLVNRGELTLSELELDYDFLDPDFSEEDCEPEPGVPNTYYPNEDRTMEVAGKWSLNPMSLNQIDTQPGVGWIGNLTWTFRLKK